MSEQPDDDGWIDFEPDETDALRDPAWKRELLGDIPTRVLGQLPVVRYVQIRMTPEVANLATRIGKTYGLSREGWIRKVLAEAMSAEVPGTTPDEVFSRMPRGKMNVTDRPETRRT